jgi:predicted esterase
MIGPVTPSPVTLAFAWGLALSTCGTLAFAGDAPAQVEGVRCERRTLGGDPDKACFFIRRVGADGAPVVATKVLVVLPGGDGSESFNPFVQNLTRWAVPEGYLVVQLVAPRFRDDQQVVWPTKRNPVKGMDFTSEAFIREAVREGGREPDTNLDPRHVYTLSWSSGGPAAYAESLSIDTPVKGSLVAMAVFVEKWLPPLKAAEGQRYYLLQSPDDAVTPLASAELAERELESHGATVKLQTYPGGHGWHGDPVALVREGVAWLEEGGGND